MITNILENNFVVEILYYMIETPNKSFSITKLKDLTNFSNNSLYSGLKTLLAYEILVKDKKKYALNYQNDLTHKLKKLLIDEKNRFKFISTKAFLNIRKIIKFLETKKFDKVYLFGSYARGDQNINSDIDIAIFSKNRNEICEWQLYFKNKNILVEFHNFNKINKKNSLQKNIFEEGILLLR